MILRRNKILKNKSLNLLVQIRGEIISKSETLVKNMEKDIILTRTV